MLGFSAPTAGNSTLSDALDVIDKVVKVVAVLIAGAWGYLNYRRGRTFKRRLEPKVSGKIFVKNGTSLLCGEAQLKNVGLSVVTIEQEGTAIVIDDKLLVGGGDKSAKVVTERAAVLEVFKNHGWIEPGEAIEESFLIALPERSNRIAARLRLRIVSTGIEWNNDAIAEISQENVDKGAMSAFTIKLPDMLVQKIEDRKETEQIDNQKSSGTGIA